MANLGCLKDFSSAISLLEASLPAPEAKALKIITKQYSIALTEQYKLHQLNQQKRVIKEEAELVISYNTALITFNFLKKLKRLSAFDEAFDNLFSQYLNQANSRFKYWLTRLQYLKKQQGGC